MTRKNFIAPEALQALLDFKMEMSDELGIQTHNNMTKSEYPAFMNNLDPNDKNLDNELHNHDIY
ncbi:MAG: small, acid-soluble spore protein, alpha/beta type [Mobilitalea sp.]